MFIWRVALLQVANLGIVGTLRSQTKCVQNSPTRDLFFGMESWGSFSGVRSEVLTKQSVSGRGQIRDLFFGMELW